MKTSAHPFDDIRNLANTVPGHNDETAQSVLQRLESHGKNLFPLGHMGASIAWLAGWQGRDIPQINKPLVAVFIGSHGVAQTVQGGDPVERTQSRLQELSTGKAAVRGLAAAQGAGFKVYNMGTEQPAHDMSVQASLSEHECAAALAFGMEVVAEGADLMVLGSAGLGSATAAAGIVRSLYGGEAKYWAGGDDEHAALRVAAVTKAASLHRDILGDPLQVLRCFGGRDIAGLVGALLAARHQKIPVLLDGFVVCAAAAIVHEMNPDGLAHCQAAHMSVEPAHGALLDRIEKTPLFELGIGIGDGSGATIALGALKAAVSGYKELTRDAEE